MKPAFSVIFFTVASGAGLGLLSLVGLGYFGVLSLLPAPALARTAAVGYALTVAGLCASTLHLANPRNAWRSFARFRTSWLSREAVFALAFLAVAAAFIALLALNVGGALRAVLAVATIALAWIVLVCTAMIYASLKPIRQWHTVWTAPVYFLLGHWSGAVVLCGVVGLQGFDATLLTVPALVLGAAASFVKWVYWRAVDDAAGGATLEQAIGVAQGVRPPLTVGAPSIMRARLLDSGHSKRTFLTDEFGFTLARRHRSLLRAVFWGAGIILPLLWVALGSYDVRVAAAACAACIVGVLAERWLFFAEARHTVRLYHGDART